MRISWVLSSARSGAVSLEAILILPVLVGFVLMARVVSESLLLRADTSSDLRQAVVSDAETSVCMRTTVGTVPREGVDRNAYVFCWRQDEETVTQQETTFQEAMRKIAQPAAYLLDDIGRDMRADAVLASASGQAAFESGYFLHQRDDMRTTQRRAWPESDTWMELDQPWRDGLDPTLYRELSRYGSAIELFSRVFPAGRN